jgi:hypothetical protein
MTDYEFLALAFPAEPFAAYGTCAWCGNQRRRDHALCRRCWRGLSIRERSEYLGLELIHRDAWIIDRIPGRLFPAMSS